MKKNSPNTDSRQIQLFSAYEDNQPVQPLPLQVASDYNFALQYHTQDDDTIVYAIQDWIAGLSGASLNSAQKTWSKMNSELEIQSWLLPYTANSGKSYQMDFTTDEGLYQIAQAMRAMKKRPQLQDIKDFLAKAGAFADALRQDPETIEVKITSLRQTRTAQIAEKHGKSAEWVAARDSGVMTRKQFTAMLMRVNSQVNIGRATNEVYKGVFGRDAEGIRKVLSIGEKQNPRDHMSRLGLIYTMAAEEVVRIRLQGYGDNDIVSAEDVHATISMLARVTGTQAQEMARLVGIDLVSGRTLLNR